MKNYYQVLFEHEKSQCFRSLLPQAAVGNTTTKMTIEHLWGNHCSGSGILTTQEPTYTEIIDTDGKKIKLVAPITLDGMTHDTSAVQDLVVCRMLQFMMEHSNISAFDTSKIDEKTRYHADWTKEGVDLKSLREIMDVFLTGSDLTSNQKLLAIYARIITAKVVYESIIGKNTYNTGGRWFFYDNHMYPRYVLSHKSGKNITEFLDKIFPDFAVMSDFINLQHFLVDLINRIDLNDELKHLIDGIFSNAESFEHDIESLCAQTLQLTKILTGTLHTRNGLVTNYETVREFQVQLLKPVLSILASKLLDSSSEIEIAKIITTMMTVKDLTGGNLERAGIATRDNPLAIHVKQIIDHHISLLLNLVDSETLAQELTESNEDSFSEQQKVHIILRYNHILEQLIHMERLLDALKVAHAHETSTEFALLEVDGNESGFVIKFQTEFKIDDGIAKIRLARANLEKQLSIMYGTHQVIIDRIIADGFTDESYHDVSRLLSSTADDAQDDELLVIPGPQVARTSSPTVSNPSPTHSTSSDDSKFSRELERIKDSDTASLRAKLQSIVVNVNHIRIRVEAETAEATATAAVAAMAAADTAAVSLTPVVDALAEPISTVPTASTSPTFLEAVAAVVVKPFGFLWGHTATQQQTAAVPGDLEQRLAGTTLALFNM